MCEFFAASDDFACDEVLSDSTIGYNPAVIPRNHVVEAALSAVTAGNDLAPLENLLAMLATPYDAVDKPDARLNPPPRGTPRGRTFCGT